MSFVWTLTTGLNLVVVCRMPNDNLTPEERDGRTVFCMQLAARIRPRDLEEFFSAVGKVLQISVDLGHSIRLPLW